MFQANGILRLWRLAMWGGAALLLSLPAIAMAFFPDAGVDWSFGDFVLMGTMLFVACSVVEVGAHLADNFAYLCGFIFAVGTGFVTVWVNIAVGMIQDEGNPMNLVFLGVLVVAIVGTLLARFKASGMSTVMLVTGATQALIGLCVLAFGMDNAFTAMLIAAFALPWWVSAGLFRVSANSGGAFARAG
jgi:hypothetical protein